MRLAAIASIGWRPSLFGWRPSLVGWRPSLLGWRPTLFGWRALLLGWRPSLAGRLEAIAIRLAAIAIRLVIVAVLCCDVVRLHSRRTEAKSLTLWPALACKMCCSEKMPQNHVESRIPRQKNHLRFAKLEIWSKAGCVPQVKPVLRPWSMVLYILVEVSRGLSRKDKDLPKPQLYTKALQAMPPYATKTIKSQ